MDETQIRAIKGLVFLAALWLLPTPGQAATITVDCPSASLQAAIHKAKPGDTLLVSGTCNENVAIPAEVVRITLDGRGKATIHGPVGTAHVVLIRGKEITIRGFTIAGGSDGIHLSGAAGGASAIIDSNTIQNTGDSGIHMDQTSVARIGNNKIQNNPRFGIKQRGQV